MDQTALRPKPMPGQEHGSGGKFGGSSKFGRGGKPGVRQKLGIGRKPGAGRTPGPGRVAGPGHRPHAARRRGRRLATLLFGLLFSVVLVLSGVGLGTVSATVIGMSKLADMQKQSQAQGGATGDAAGRQAGPAAPGGDPAPGAASGPAAPPDPPQKQPGRQPGKAPERTPARPALGVEAVDAPGGPGALLAGVHSPGPGHSAGLVRGDVVLAFGRTRVASAKALATAVAAADPGRNITVTVRHANGQRQSLSVTPGFVT
ncbi:PDZ domain-containing protein [Streptomyces longisporoflavus]|uniref:PDZ domain-containing protein n=1 Tax=Streptomyces longisporoflavus TaxID=28044 RepID=UPI00198731D2|nr:PDZ domain-containing protein [Streptomyces longisporoflavus]GGV45696.1 PDZ domain-containing protein [Streptomyces longisporoflavus]